MASSFKQQILKGRIVEGMSFNEKVWALTVRIPAGKVTTYAHLARALGTTAYRAVGNAMNKNPFAPEVPCHRVVGSDRRLVGYAGGLDVKRRMLREEGVRITADKVDPACVIAVELR